MGDGFYRSKDPTNSIKVLKENLQRKKNTNNAENIIQTEIRNSTRHDKAVLFNHIANINTITIQTMTAH